MTKRVAIIGAGLSGLLACKHTMKMGFDPVVFESRNDIGGVWLHTIDSTKLQTPKEFFQFTDFPWPTSVPETFPDHRQVLAYLRAYAAHFNLLQKIKFGSKVTAIDFEGAFSQEDGFSSPGRWIVSVVNSADSMNVRHEFDFVILCVGRYSGLPNIPEFPVNKGPEIFEGHAMHSMDFANMDRAAVAEIVAGKRVVVVGFQKSAFDLAVEIASKNGKEHPCTLLFRSTHWTVPEDTIRRSLKSMSRFSEMLVHYPREGIFRWFLVLLLSPMLWIISKFMESYLKRIYPLEKYNLVPSHGYFHQVFSCRVTAMPPTFYEKVNKGSILLKKMNTFHFSEDGVILDNREENHIPADAVIFATGYRGEEKLKHIFSSPEFKACFESSSSLYRECIHPRIPQLAILGYANGTSVLFTTEMRSKWVAHILTGKVKIPAAAEMEKEVAEWENCMRKYGSNGQKESCWSAMLQIHFHDQLCMDMGINPRRKKWFLPEIFSSYSPTDYT